MPNYDRYTSTSPQLLLRVQPRHYCHHDINLTKTKRGRVFPLLTQRQEQLIYEPKNRPGQHSRKPPETRDRIVELYGDRSRVELFSREEVEGWNAFGDELIAA